MRFIGKDIAKILQVASFTRLKNIDMLFVVGMLDSFYM